MKKGIFLILMLLGGLVLYIVHAQSISVRAGYITKATLYAQASTWRWGGVIGFLASGSCPTTRDSVSPPIHAVGGFIREVSLSYLDCKDGKHYIAAFPLIGISSDYKINASLIKNVTLQDLEEFGLFNETNYPIFHPHYYEKSDNPKTTFCCENETLLINGKPFTAFKIILKEDVPLYLLKYEYNSTFSVPLFLAKLSDYTCYNSTPCNFELMFPDGKHHYNLYILPKYPVYEIKVWIDGEETMEFEKTALPYNLTVKVIDAFTKIPVPNVEVMVFEENGNNIFVPKTLSGKISRGMSYATTNANGIAEFIIAPTKYTDVEEVYSIGVGLYSDSLEIQKRINLTVSEWRSIPREKKRISNPSLSDNAKASVNNMNQIINYLYKWCNEYKKAWQYEIEFYTNGSYRIKNLTDGQYYSSAILKTGAPNVLTIKILNPDGTSSSSAYAIIEEKDGYLVFNPTLNPSAVSPSKHVHKGFKFYNNEKIIITPTSYKGFTSTTVKLKLYSSSGSLLGEIEFGVDDTLSFDGGSAYSDDALKTMVNAINQVIYSLYYALN